MKCNIQLNTSRRWSLFHRMDSVEYYYESRTKVFPSSVSIAVSWVVPLCTSLHLLRSARLSSTSRVNKVVLMVPGYVIKSAVCCIPFYKLSGNPISYTFIIYIVLHYIPYTFTVANY